MKTTKKAKWRRKVSAAFVCLVLAALVMSVTAAAVSMPKPTEEFYVADFANVLDRTTEEYIISKNRSLESKNGAQVVVVTVDSTESDIEDYAYRLFNDWGIGSSAYNNGVLILFAIGDDNYYIMTGYGIEDDFPSSVIYDMIDNKTEPYFAKKDYNNAASATFDAFVTKLETMSFGGTAIRATMAARISKIRRKSRAFQPTVFFHCWLYFAVVIIILVLIIILSVVSSFTRPRFYGGWWFLGLGGYMAWWRPEAEMAKRTWHHHLPDRQDQAVALVEDGQEALAVRSGGFGGARGGGGGTRGGGGGRR